MTRTVSIILASSLIWFSLFFRHVAGSPSRAVLTLLTLTTFGFAIRRWMGTTQKNTATQSSSPWSFIFRNVVLSSFSIGVTVFLTWFLYFLIDGLSKGANQNIVFSMLAMSPFMFVGLLIPSFITGIVVGTLNGLLTWKRTTRPS